jgi:hypothetical protein
MAVVIDSEKPDDPGYFVRLYKTCCVLGSLNSKRSFCQQAASDCVKALLKAKQHGSEGNQYSGNKNVIVLKNTSFLLHTNGQIKNEKRYMEQTLFM